MLGVVLGLMPLSLITMIGIGAVFFRRRRGAIMRVDVASLVVRLLWVGSAEIMLKQMLKPMLKKLSVAR